MKSKKLNLIKILIKIPYYILMILCIILIIIILMQKITDSRKSIAGYRLFVVATGSMEPKYGIGEVVICKEVNKEQLKVGDVIVYKGTSGEFNGMIIMHEIVDIYYNENDELKIHARGIANSQDDPEISEEQIYGVVKYKSDILTLLYKLATNQYSSIFIFMILIANVFFSFKTTKNPYQFEEEINIDEENVSSIEEEGKKENIEDEKIENKLYDEYIEQDEKNQEGKEIEGTESKLYDEYIEKDRKNRIEKEDDE